MQTIISGNELRFGFIGALIVLLSLTQIVFAQTTVNCVTAAGDGYISGPEGSVYSNVRNATTGSSMSYTGMGANIGQSYTGNYNVHRGFFPFDTRSIPSNAQIVTAVIKIWGLFNNSATDFDICAVQSTQLSVDALVGTDYARVGSTVGGYELSQNYNTSGYTTIYLDDTGKSWISKGGWTKLAIRSREDINNSTPTNDEWIAVYCKEGSNPPILTITYELNPVPPNAPVPYSPPDGQSTNDMTPDLAWNLTDNTTYYHVQIDNNSNFSSPEREIQDCPSTNWTPAEMNSGTYYWRVRAHGSNGLWSNWSVTWSFTIQSLSVETPVLYLPTNQTVTDDTTPDLVWYLTANTNYYHVQIDNNSSFSSPERETQSWPSTNWTPAEMSDGTYFWRVRAHGSNGLWSAWSEYWQFTIQTSGALILTSPLNSTIITDEVIFLWSNANAQYYELMVDEDINFQSPEISSQHLTMLRNFTGTTFQISGNWLTPGVQYWKVRALLSNGSSIESAVAQFTYSPPLEIIPVWLPLFRMWNSTDTDHFYITSDSHRQIALNDGYKDERVEGYLSIKRFDAVDLVEVYRFYNGTKKCHYYTTSISDRNSQIQSGLIYEGMTGFGYANSGEDLTPLYHLSSSVDDFYTISEFERNNAIQALGFSDQGIVAYVSKTGADVLIPFQESQALTGEGVNAVNGNFSHYTKSSFNIPGIGLPLTFEHIYNSLGVVYKSTMIPLGPGWSHSYLAYIDLGYSDTKVALHWPDGSLDLYDKNGSIFTPTVKSIYDEMTLVSSQYQVKRKNQLVYIFTVPSGAPAGCPAVLTSIRDRNNNTITCSYETVEPWRLVTVTDASGRTLQISYNTTPGMTHLIKQVSGPLSRSVYFDFDNNGLLIKFTDALNQTTQYEYDTTTAYEHLLKKILLPKGNYIDNTYLGRKLQSQNFKGSAASLVLDYQSYQTSVTDEEGHMTNYEYNANQYVAKISDVGGYEQYWYEDLNNPSKPTRMMDRNGNTTYMNYDAKGNVLQVERPTGTVRFTYDSFNNPLTTTNPIDQITSFGYDSRGNLTSKTDPLSHTTRWNRLSNGLVESMVNPNNHTTRFTYDQYGNVLSITDPLNYVSSFSYDAGSRKLQSINPKNQITRFGYNNNDLVTSITDALNGVTNYGYDANDNQQSITDANLQSTQWGYDDQDLLTSISNALTQQTSFTYNADGTLASRSFPGGPSANYSYNAEGRVQTISSGSYSATFTYDGNGNIIQVSDNTGSIHFTYDASNRMLSHTDFYSNTVSYGYDSADHITRITYPNSKTVWYTYYDDGRLHTVQDWNSNVTQYSYRADGSLQQILYPNGTYIIYSYDGADRLSGVSNQTSGGQVIAAYTYALDEIGNHSSVNSQEPFTAPSLSETSIAYAFDVANRIQSVGSDQFNFNANGTLASQTGGRNLSYTWDWDNRLTTISQGISASFIYDVFGHRRAATRTGVTTRYVLDINASLSQVLMEQDASGNVINYYVYGLGLISRIKPDGTTHYYHHNNVGSIIAMTNQSQTITHKYQYDPFGNVLQMQEADSNPCRFVGQWGVMDEGNGLHFMRARYYDSVVGRFISEDPEWQENLFEYAVNNPQSYFDADGKKAESVGNRIFKYNLKAVEKGTWAFLKPTLFRAGKSGYANWKYTSNLKSLPAIFKKSFQRSTFTAKSIKSFAKKSGTFLTNVIYKEAFLADTETKDIPIISDIPILGPLFFSNIIVTSDATVDPSYYLNNH